MPLELPDAETTAPVTAAQVQAFAVASGDTNPLHLSDESARAAGLRGAVLHGMFIAGRFEAFLERIPGHRIGEFRVHFTRPVAVGSCLTISARPIAPAGGLPHLRLMAHDGTGVLVAVADARLVKLDGGVGAES
ncbi:MAG: MaoC family dehydratase [Aestuariivirga sp.]|uniref:MaoC family dehydratase n=1 Tax=Aestuariivirga sp. TaxID=2650926 RepID=UPI0025C0ECA6|nr:MaoC family dehydratase [Aestuariivirga sp.]MCA3561696.1 MaoC family dehydratase [Aestuariivirga sp.]